ncbi:hypothetical protein P5704_028020 (plasmid) [Pseudomonas sp. FeN3W]|nr:hypothetical protein P5704_028020 [Pseudomonas sp. FeN3W]
MRTPVSDMNFLGDNKYEIAHKLTAVDIDWGVEFSKAAIESFAIYDEEYLYSRIPNFPYGLIELFKEMQGLHLIKTHDEYKSIWGVFESVLENNPNVARWYVLFNLAHDHEYSANDARIIEFITGLGANELITISAYLYMIREKTVFNENSFDPDCFNSVVVRMVETALLDDPSPPDLLESGQPFLSEMHKSSTGITILASSNLYKKAAVVSGKYFTDLPALVMIDKDHFGVGNEFIDNCLSDKASLKLMHWLSKRADDASHEILPVVQSLPWPSCPFGRYGEYVHALAEHEIVAAYNKYQYNYFEDADLSDIEQITASLQKGGYAHIIGKDGLDAFSLISLDHQINKNQVDDYIELHKGELIGVYSFRYFNSAAVVGSLSGSLLFLGLNQRIRKLTAINKNHPEIKAINDIMAYAALKIMVMVRDHLMIVDLSGVPDAGKRREQIGHLSIDKLARFTSLKWSYGSFKDLIINESVWSTLSDELQTIDNKIFAGISLSKEDFQKATQDQKKIEICNRLDI